MEFFPFVFSLCLRLRETGLEGGEGAIHDLLPADVAFRFAGELGLTCAEKMCITCVVHHSVVYTLRIDPMGVIPCSLVSLPCALTVNSVLPRIDVSSSLLVCVTDADLFERFRVSAPSFDLVTSTSEYWPLTVRPVVVMQILRFLSANYPSYRGVEIDEGRFEQLSGVMSQLVAAAVYVGERGD